MVFVVTVSLHLWGRAARSFLSKDAVTREVGSLGPEKLGRGDSPASEKTSTCTFDGEFGPFQWVYY